MVKAKKIKAAKIGFAKAPVGGRTLREYYDVAALPLLALVTWSVVGFGLNYLTVGLAGGTVASITLLLQLVAGVYIGFLTVEKFKDSRKSDAAIAGGLAGLINGTLIMTFELVRGNSIVALSSPFMGLLTIMVSAVIGAWICKKLFGK